MYDLSDLRGQLRGFIEGLGWRAVMAEHGSFSVDATETTVENSLRNVRENADVFVMIVGRAMAPSTPMPTSPSPTSSSVRPEPVECPPMSSLTRVFLRS